MKSRSIPLVSIAVCAALLASGCASPPAPKQSGFLSNYSMLHKDDAPGGGSRLVYQNPNFNPANYDAVWLEPLEYYPAPQATDKVSTQTLAELREYGDRALRQKLGQRIRLVDGPGPRVAHWRIAITAVGAETEALKAYQYIPIGLAITGVMAVANGGRPETASVAIENHITDSVTHQLLFASVRGGTGEQIKSTTQGKATVQADDLKPLIDQWTDAAAGEMSKYVNAR